MSHTSPALEIARTLVSYPSVTPVDAGVQDWIAHRLERLGFTCTHLHYGEVQNLFAVLEPKANTNTAKQGRHFCFAGHTDVVPPGPEGRWTHPPFGAVVTGGRLYGRGAADMKGNIACFIAAVEQYVETYGPPCAPLSFLITGDEEGRAIDGTRRVLEWLDARGPEAMPDAFLVGEPTNPVCLGEQIKIGRRGSMTGHLRVQGKQGHVAYPDKARNPVPDMLRLLAALDALVLDEGNAHFEPSNLEITTVDVGNAAENVIPGDACATFNVRFNDLWDAETLAPHIRKTLDEAGISYELDMTCSGESFLTAPGPLTEIVAAAVARETGRTSALTTGGGTSDARFISRYRPVVEFGLVNETIHQIDEHVAIADLDTLTAVYVRILTLWYA